MGFSNLLSRSLCLVVAIALIASTCVADDVILDGKSGPQTLGHFSCSNSTAATNMILFDGRDSGSLTTGELWKIFHDQGISSVKSLTFCVDVKDNGESNTFGINSMELTIEDTAILGSQITTYNSGDQSLMINGDDIMAFKPEANLEIQLDYDFMERYSSESTEKISFAVSGDQNSELEISVPLIKAGGFFSWEYIAVGAFAIFWGLVFVVLNRFTKPQVIVPEKTGVSPHKRRALSA